MAGGLVSLCAGPVGVIDPIPQLQTFFREGKETAMKIRICLAALSMSFLTFQAGALAGETLESVEKKVIEKWSKLKSMSAKTTMEMTMQGMSMKSDGTTEYLNDQGK